MSLKFLIGLSSLCAMAGQAAAQSTGEACARIEDDASRFECYDLVFRADRIDSAVQGDTGKWDVTEDVSKFDDSRKVVLRLQSEDTSPGQFGGQRHSWLYAACRENETNLWMTFADNFMATSLGGGEVTYRFDKQPAAKQTFSESNDNEALGLWSNRTAIAFLKDMIGKETLIVRATPFNESSVTVTYDIRGLEEAIKPLQTACNW